MKLSKIYLLLLLASTTLLLYSCDSSDIISDPSEIMTTDELSMQNAKKGSDSITLSTSTDYISHTVVLGYAEYITDPASNERVKSQILCKNKIG